MHNKIKHLLSATAVIFAGAANAHEIGTPVTTNTVNRYQNFIDADSACEPISAAKTFTLEQYEHCFNHVSAAFNVYQTSYVNRLKRQIEGSEKTIAPEKETSLFGAASYVENRCDNNGWVEFNPDRLEENYDSMTHMFTCLGAITHSMIASTDPDDMTMQSNDDDGFFTKWSDFHLTQLEDSLRAANFPN